MRNFIYYLIVLSWKSIVNNAKWRASMLRQRWPRTAFLSSRFKITIAVVNNWFMIRPAREKRSSRLI